MSKEQKAQPQAPMVKLGPGVAFDPASVVAMYIKPDQPAMVVWIARTSGVTVHADQTYNGHLQAAFDKLFDAVNAFRETPVQERRP